MGCSFIAGIQSAVGKVADVAAPIVASIPGPWQIPAMVYIANNTIKSGGDIGDVALKIGTAYFAGQLGAGASEAVANSLMGNGMSVAAVEGLGRIAGGAAAGMFSGGLSGLATQSDPIDAILRGGLTGALTIGVTQGVGSLTSSTPGFSDLSKYGALGTAAQRAANAAITSGVLGKDVDQSILSSVLNSVVSTGKGYLKDLSQPVQEAWEKLTQTSTAYRDNVDLQNEIVAQYEATRNASNSNIEAQRATLQANMDGYNQSVERLAEIDRAVAAGTEDYATLMAVRGQVQQRANGFAGAIDAAMPGYSASQAAAKDALDALSVKLGTTKAALEPIQKQYDAQQTALDVNYSAYQAQEAANTQFVAQQYKAAAPPAAEVQPATDTSVSGGLPAGPPAISQDGNLPTTGTSTAAEVPPAGTTTRSLSDGAPPAAPEVVPLTSNLPVDTLAVAPEVVPPTSNLPVNTPAVKPDYGLSNGVDMTSGLTPPPVVGNKHADGSTNFDIAAPTTSDGLTQPVAPTLSTMNGGYGLITKVDGGYVTDLGFVPDDKSSVLGDPKSFVNDPNAVGKTVIGTDTLNAPTKTVPIPTGGLPSVGMIGGLTSGVIGSMIGGTNNGAAPSTSAGALPTYTDQAALPGGYKTVGKAGYDTPEPGLKQLYADLLGTPDANADVVPADKNFITMPQQTIAQLQNANPDMSPYFAHGGSVRHFDEGGTLNAAQKAIDDANQKELMQSFARLAAIGTETKPPAHRLVQVPASGMPYQPKVLPQLAALLQARGMRLADGGQPGGHPGDHEHPNYDGTPVFRTGGLEGLGGKYVEGKGDGTSDDISAMLADGEYVFSADVVSALGNGSNKAGAERLGEMVKAIRERARSASVDKLPPDAKSPLEYLKSSKGNKHG